MIINKYRINRVNKWINLIKSRNLSNNNYYNNSQKIQSNSNNKIQIICNKLSYYNKSVRKTSTNKKQFNIKF